MINIKTLKAYCKREIDEYFTIAGETENQYIYIDNDAPVLGIAHLDFIPNSPHFETAALDGLYIFNSRLDDRLGVYLLLETLPLLVNYPYDILLTTGEETGRSTAREFKPQKDYNWTFELDRAGLDAVTYGLDNKEFKKHIRKAGFKINYGTYTDIRDLAGKECRVNFGIGYHQQHTNLCHAKLKDILKAIRRIAEFYNAHYNDAYERDVIKVYTPYRSDYSSRFNNYNYWDNYSDTCDLCYKILKYNQIKHLDGLYLCKDCYDAMIDADTSPEKEADTVLNWCDNCGKHLEVTDGWHINDAVLCDECAQVLALNDADH